MRCDDGRVSLASTSLAAIAHAWTALALVAGAVLMRVPPPFGRHTSARWGPTLDTRLGWFAMELPSLAIMTAVLALAAPVRASFAWILFALWVAHYANRTLVYPLRIRPAARRMPLVIVGSAIAFNLVNASLNGAWLATHAADYDAAWLASPRFALGAALFALGAYVNLKSDAMLIALRRGGAGGYSIPRGFLFERVSAPNLFGESIEWLGFAVMAANPAAWSFCVWTIANLLPRAKHHHAWYRARFPDYPPARRAMIPWLY
jgi:hypothetical protein